MNLHLSDEQEQLVRTFAALYAKESPPERVRAAEPLGFDRRLWELLVETGCVSMAVDEAAGGWGASLLDLALVAREHGRALGSAPLIECLVAARLLARAGGEAAAALLPGIMSGERLVATVFRPLRSGVAELVPGGAVATDVLVRHGDDLKFVTVGEGRTNPENVGSMPLADIPIPEDVLAGATVIGDPGCAQSAVEAALDDWLVLTSNALVGMARRSLEIGVTYVNEREAFGQKIGSFQAIGHRLADGATATDGAELLALEAAWAFDGDPDRAPALSAMAFAFAAETARDVTDDVLHFHGGYGFMLEYDIQLYYRRSRSWANVVMSPSKACRRVADHRYGRQRVR